MLDRPSAVATAAADDTAEDLEVRRSWRERWQAAPTFEKVAGVTVAAILALLVILGLAWTFTPASAPSKPGTPRLIGGMEVPLAEAINKGVDQRFNPRFQKIEDAQKKTDQNVDGLSKRVTTLEIPPPAFNYQLLTDTIAGKK